MLSTVTILVGTEYFKKELCLFIMYFNTHYVLWLDIIAVVELI